MVYDFVNYFSELCSDGGVFENGIFALLCILLLPAGVSGKAHGYLQLPVL
jgi:hypothetical protein